MEVFKLDPDANRYQGITPVSDDDRDLLSGFDGTPRAATWVPMRVKLTNPDLLAGDCPSFRSAIPIFSLRAAELLADLLEPNGELLPLVCNDGDYFAFNVTALPNILDEDQSVIRRFRSGRILDITQYHFSERSTEGGAIFKLPQIPSLWVFVTEEFVERVHSRGLRGIEFHSVWRAQ